MTPDERPARTRPTTVISGAMPRPAMYEFLRENFDYVGAVNAAREMLADDRSAEDRHEP